jgi:TraB/PrgY/gumN family
MKERGDDELTVVLGVVADFMRKQNLQKDQPAQALPDFDLTDLLDSGKLKRMMAQQFESAGEDGGLGKTVNQILVQDRNKACMKVLSQQLTAGKKKIAIFYGAAHMPDFDKRLKEDFGMKRSSDNWIKAWNLEDDGMGELLKKLLE